MSCKMKRLVGSLCMMMVMTAVIMLMTLYDTVGMDVSAANTGDNSQEIYELEKELKGAKDEAAALQKKINASKTQQLSYQQQINNIDGEISILTEQLSLVENLTAAWNEDMEKTREEIEALEIKMENEILIFESMLRMSYQYGTDTYFSLIFGSENIGDFLSRSDLIGYHLKANDNIVAGLADTITSLEKKKEKHQVSIEKIATYGAQQEAIQKELEQKSAEARAQKEKLAANQKTLQAELDAKNAEMNAMEANIRKLYEQSVKDGSLQAWDGKTFFIPTENYRITSEFANRISPITGKRENHNGLDMAAPGGTNIYAAADGKVIDSRYSSSWGNVIQIDHGGGIVTLYAHCSYRAVQAGQVVKRGQVIGKVGTTGWSTGNHLHFTVYKQGVAQNPRNYLPKDI